jgi:hypothetical protein
MCEALPWWCIKSSINTFKKEITPIFDYSAIIFLNAQRHRQLATPPLISKRSKKTKLYHMLSNSSTLHLVTPCLDVGRGSAGHFPGRSCSIAGAFHQGQACCGDLWSSETAPRRDVQLAPRFPIPPDAEDLRVQGGFPHRRRPKWRSPRCRRWWPWLDLTQEHRRWRRTFFFSSLSF